MLSDVILFFVNNIDISYMYVNYVNINCVYMQYMLKEIYYLWENVRFSTYLDKLGLGLYFNI